MLLDPYDGDQIESISNAQEPVTKRGRKRIPESWTRVISVSCDNLTKVKGYCIATDLLVNDGIEPPIKRKNAKQWNAIFWPKQFVTDNEDLELDNYRLSEKKLRKYGELVSASRKSLRESALTLTGKSILSIHEKVNQTTRLAKKMSRWDRQERLNRKNICPADYQEETSILK